MPLAGSSAAPQPRGLRYYWLDGASRIVVVDLGAGAAIPSVRNFSKTALIYRGAILVRINPEKQIEAAREGVRPARGKRYHHLWPRTKPAAFNNARHASLRRQPHADVHRARLRRSLCGGSGRWFRRGRVPVSVRARTDELARRLCDHRLNLVLFNLQPGDWTVGERGLAALPGREAEFADSVETALAYALASGCRQLHAMAGLVPASASATDRAAMHHTYVANLRCAARVLAPHGITLLIEPINTRDMPGYFLSHQQAAHDVAAEVGEPNLKVLMDLYHCQIMEGDVATRLRRHIAGVGHLQIAGVPDRHEPDSGELNCPFLFELIDALGYPGHIGCEYRPRAGTSAGLGWWRRARQG